MSLDCIRECADKARLSPCVQEFRTVQLTIREYVYAGERVGSGSKELVRELVMPKYEVAYLGSRELLANVGRYNKGDVRVKDISPPYVKADGSGQGGYTQAQLDPQSAWTAPDYDQPVRKRAVEYVLTGEVNGVFALLDLENDNVTSWGLVLTNTRKSP